MLTCDVEQVKSASDVSVIIAALALVGLWIYERDFTVFDVNVICLFSGQTRRTLFDVLRDENNFTELCEKRKNRHSSGETSPLSKTSPTETKLEELQQENHI